MKCDHITQLHSTTCVENTEKVTFAIYVMTHGLRVSFFIVELTLVITYIPMYMCESTVQSINCIPLDG